MADGHAVERAQTTDEVFAALTRRHVDDGFRLAWAILGDTQSAEDATQDAFAMAWRKRRDLRDPARFDAWFGRILVNTCREHLRRRGRSRIRQVEVLPEPGGGDETLHVGLRADIGDALGALDVDHRIVVVLRYWADLTVDDIADRLAIPSGTVKSRLHHALRTLHVELEDVR